MLCIRRMSYEKQNINSARINIMRLIDDLSPATSSLLVCGMIPGDESVFRQICRLSSFCFYNRNAAHIADIRPSKQLRASWTELILVDPSHRNAVLMSFTPFSMTSRCACFKQLLTISKVQLTFVVGNIVVSLIDTDLRWAHLHLILKSSPLCQRSRNLSGLHS